MRGTMPGTCVQCQVAQVVALQESAIAEKDGRKQAVASRVVACFASAYILRNHASQSAVARAADRQQGYLAVMNRVIEKAAFPSCEQHR